MCAMIANMAQSRDALDGTRHKQHEGLLPKGAGLGGPLPACLPTCVRRYSGVLFFRTSTPHVAFRSPASSLWAKRQAGPTTQRPRNVGDATLQAFEANAADELPKYCCVKSSKLAELETQHVEAAHLALQQMGPEHTRLSRSAEILGQNVQSSLADPTDPTNLDHGSSSSPSSFPPQAHPKTRQDH